VTGVKGNAENSYRTGNVNITPANLGIITSDVKPILQKTYSSTSFYASTSNDSATATFFFVSIKPDAWYKPWTIKFKIHSYCPAYTNVDSVTYGTISGRTDGYVYANWNERYDPAYYYTSITMLKKAGFDAGLGHALGINLVYGTGYTNSAYYRTFEFELYETNNCTVTTLNTPVLLANWTNYNSTNYNGLSNMNAVDRGLMESGDSDSWGWHVGNLYPRLTTGSVGLGRYTLFM